MSTSIALTGGFVVAVAVLLPPMHAFATELFSAHMLQHLVLVLVAAPLIAWGSPRFPRLGPLSVWLLHTGAMWIWHLPSIYDAALGSPSLHGLEHLSFLGTGLLFWGLALGRGGLSLLQRMGVTFATALQSGALGALLVFATRPLYTAHLGRTSAWGITPLQDQQLAGALMWIPPGTVYLLVVLVLAYRWLGQMDARTSSTRTVEGEAK